MRCFLGLCILFVGASAANADLLNYHFDSNNEGWRRGDFDFTHNSVTDLGAATWNAGGYIDGDDFATWAFHLSPVVDMSWSSATSINFDYSSAASDASYPFVIIASATAALVQNATIPADGQFHHYNYNFTPGTWLYADATTNRVATAGDIASVLSVVHQFGVNADQSVGPEYTRLDNVVVVPEPASLATLTVGFLAFCLRRRKGE